MNTPHYNLWNLSHDRWIRGYCVVRATHPYQWPDMPLLLSKEEAEKWRASFLNPGIFEIRLMDETAIAEQEAKAEDQRRRAAHADKWL